MVMNNMKQWMFDLWGHALPTKLFRYPRLHWFPRHLKPLPGKSSRLITPLQSLCNTCAHAHRAHDDYRKTKPGWLEVINGWSVLFDHWRDRHCAWHCISNRKLIESCWFIINMEFLLLDFPWSQQVDPWDLIQVDLDLAQNRICILSESTMLILKRINCMLLLSCRNLKAS